MEELRIAAVIPGRITYNPESFEFLQRLSEKNNLTFFFSINLPFINKQAQSFITEFGLKENQYSVEQTIFPEYLESLASSQDIFLKSYTMNIKLIYSHQYHSKKCLDLITAFEKENNIVFDGILKIRSDILSSEIFSIGNFESNKCFIPQGYDWLGGINDNIAYGNKDIMKLYLSMVDILEDYMIKGINLHPENLLREYLSKTQIQVFRFSFQYTLDLTRYEQEKDPSWLLPFS
jgi:hypothetical protein